MKVIDSSAAVYMFCAVYLQVSRNVFRSSIDVGETAAHYSPYINIPLNVDRSTVNNSDAFSPEPRNPTA